MMSTHSEGPAVPPAELQPASVAVIAQRLLDTAYPGVRFHLRVTPDGNGRTLLVDWRGGPPPGEVEALLDPLQAQEADGAQRFAWLLPDHTARLAHIVGGGAAATFLPPTSEARLVRSTIDLIVCRREDT